jgi:hypothetical protein
MTTTNTSSNSTSKRGAKGGPRQRFFICAAIIDEELVLEQVSADTSTEAVSIFENKYNVEPLILKGDGNGYYVAKGTGQTAVQRISVTVDAEALQRRTAQAYKGTFEGWKVFASGLQACTVDDCDYADNELVSVEFASPVDESNKTAKPKMKKREVLPISLIQNVQPLSV